MEQPNQAPQMRDRAALRVARALLRKRRMTME